ncbi:MAG: DHH family phosphoesterase [Clostridia bacterium]|nr:DHH family phosphoesterase [Clostridia bacterium]
MSNKKFDFFRRVEELPSRLYVIFAVAILVVHIAICTYSDASPAVTGLILLLIYGAASLAIFLFSRRQLRLYQIESDASDEQSNSVIYAFRNSLRIPYAVVTESGKIITVNTAMRTAAGIWDTVFNTDISALCHCPMEEILQNALSDEQEPEVDEFGAEIPNQATPKKCVVSIGDQKFQIECHPLRSKGKVFYILVFHDVTQLLSITEQHHNQLTAVGYIVLDNLDEIAQYVQVSYQSEAREVETLLKNWVEQMGGMLREYERNKYIVLFSRQMLSACIKNKFEILDVIREVTIGEDNMPITISMGVAVTGETLAQRERDALVALDMALQRGGDQVVLKNETGNYFFGGRIKSQQKRLRGHSRIIAGRLCSMISGSSNVIVMGHSNPDFDSIGACIGIAALCLHLGVDVKIVTDTECDNFHACTTRLVELSAYKNMFIDGVEGLAKSSFGTLLIVVDANNFSILEAPEIAENSFKTVVIDHHIKKQEFAHEPQLSYIDPSASSACELVSEILEQILPAGTLRKEEANILMAGIMVDTKNFTRTVGTRTFAAALYLRGAGASPEYARTFFEEPFEDYRAEAQFGSEARIYREQIAITSIEGRTSSNCRIAAAKAADRLLTVRQVNAAFALIRMGNMVHISARSNGTINVQLILEKIGGGGHFDMAGAAIPESELQDAEQQLIGAIDEYFEDISSTHKES